MTSKISSFVLIIPLMLANQAVFSSANGESYITHMAPLFINKARFNFYSNDNKFDSVESYPKGSYPEFNVPRLEWGFGVILGGYCRSGFSRDKSEVRISVDKQKIIDYPDGGAFQTDLIWPVTSPLTVPFKDACNNYYQKKYSQGILQADILREATTLYSVYVYSLEHRLHCRSNNSDEVNVHKSNTTVTADVICDSYTFPTTGKGQPAATNDLRVGFQVTKVDDRTNPNAYTGVCPVNIKFGARVTANGAGQVKYRWETRKTGLGPVQTLNFAKAGEKLTPQPTMTIAQSREANEAGAGGMKGPGGFTNIPTNQPIGSLTFGDKDINTHWTRLHILSSKSSIKNAEKHFTVNCKDPKPGFASNPQGVNPQRGKLASPGNPSLIEHTRLGKNLINKKWYKLRSIKPETKTQYTHLLISSKKAELKDKKNQVTKAPGTLYSLQWPSIHYKAWPEKIITKLILAS